MRDLRHSLYRPANRCSQHQAVANESLDTTAVLENLWHGRSQSIYAAPERIHSA